MNLSKVIFLLLLPFILEISTACCNCDPAYYSTYSNCALTIKTLENSGPEPVESASTSFSKRAFGIRLNIERSEELCETKNGPSLFFPSSYAFSCDCDPEFIFDPRDSITSLKIVTVNDFDSLHPALSDISNYFFELGTISYSEIPELLNSSFYNQRRFHWENWEFDLMLMTPPTLGKEHQFIVEVQLSDGRLLEKATQMLTLN